MTNQEQIHEPNLDAVNRYFYAQFCRNRNGDPGNIEERKEKMATHLETLKNAEWFGGPDGERVDIFVAEPGTCMEVRAGAGIRRGTQYFTEDHVVGRTEEGGRQFSWAVVLVSRVPSVPRVVFQDAVTERIGVCIDGGYSLAFNFPEDETDALEIAENHLGEVFYPGSEAHAYPKDVEGQYHVFEISA